MHYKKSQISIFLFVGGFVLLLIFLGTVIQESDNTKLPSSEQTLSVDTYIQKCIDDVAESSAYRVLRQGGYSKIGEDFNEVDDAVLPSYLDEFELLMPTLDQIQNEFASAFDTEIASCLTNDNAFEVQGYQDVELTSNTAVSIEESFLSYSVSIDGTLSKGNAKYEPSLFKTTVDLRFPLLYDIGGFIIDSLTYDPLSTCVSCLASISSEHSVTIDVAHSKNAIVVAIADLENGFESLPFTFRFSANPPSLNCSHIPSGINPAIKQRTVAECISQEVDEVSA